MILERKRNSKKQSLKWFILLIFLSVVLMGQTYLFLNTSVLNPLIRSVENQIVTFKTRNFREMESENFIVRYGDVDQEILHLIVQTAEDKYRKTVEVFQYKPNNKVLLIIYDDPHEMMGATMLRKGDPPMGVYYGGSVHILDPRFWIRENQDIAFTLYYEGPLLHEIVHLFTDYVAGGNFPMWFTEGVSLYFEYMIDQYEWGKEVVFQEEEYTVEQLTNQFNQLDQYKAYTQSFRLVKGFVERHGIEELMNVIQLLGKGEPFSRFVHLF